MSNEVKEPAFKYNYTSAQDYLAAERAAEQKHEFYDGQVLAMSGASLQHLRINRNLTVQIGNFLKDGDCEILNTDMRVGTLNRDAYMYPDALIVCGEPELEDNVFDTLLNPSVIFEILSPSTRSIDKGRKFFFYQQIASLQEYIMIDSLKRFIHLARKQPDGSWMIDKITDDATPLFIRTINFTLSLEEIYAGVC